MMKKTIGKCILSLMLVTVMIVSLLPVSVMAQEDGTSAVMGAIELMGDLEIEEEMDVEAEVTISGNVRISGKGTIKRTKSEGCFIIPSGSTLTLDGVTVDGDNIVGTCAMFKVKSGGTLIIKDSIIKNCRTSGENGGAIYNSGTVRIESGTFTNNEAINANDSGGAGGFIYNTGSGAAVYMTGGNISGNFALKGGGVYNANGAAFYLSDTAAITGNTATCTRYNGYGGGGVYNFYANFYMTGGTISGNSADTAQYGGGGIFIENGSFTMSEGTITRNSANQGGGVCIYNGSAVFTMTGGSITKNSSKEYGGGVRNVSGTFEMSGGSITENTSGLSGGGVYNYANVTMYGSPIISGNVQGGSIDEEGTLTGGTANNLYMGTGKITVPNASSMDETAKVYIKAEESKTVITGTTDTTGFDCDTEGMGLVDNGSNGLMIAEVHSHKICCDSSCSDESHSDIKWEPWTSNNSLPDKEGYYYLKKDVTLDAQWDVGTTNIKLCLNGKSITGKDGENVIYVNEGRTLTITDCKGSGTITHNEGETGRGILNRGTLNFWNGSVTGNRITGQGSDDMGAGVYNGKGMETTFNMYGGSITNNQGSVYGGGVYNEKNWNMTGGSIANNSVKAFGAGVQNNGTFTMTGGSITGNFVRDTVASYTGGGVNIVAGTLNVSGNAKITGNTKNGAANNVAISGGSLTSTGLSTDANVGITGSEGQSVVAGTSDTTGFASDNQALEIIPVGETLKLSNFHKHKICGTDDCTEHEELTWKAISSLDQITGDGNYYLTGNVTLNESWTCSYKVSLCLNGHTITQNAEGHVIMTAYEASLDITDCQETVGKITHADNVKGVGVCSEGTLTLWNGSVEGNTNDGNGGGVYINEGSTFNIYGGSIKGNFAASGGGVYIDQKSTVNMTGGIITGNNATGNGGGVYHYTGKFNMTGGSITGNNAAGIGGGVYNEATLNMSGSPIVSGNKKGASFEADGTLTGGTDSNVHIAVVSIAGSWGAYGATFNYPIKVVGEMSDSADVGISGNPNQTVVEGTTDTTGFSCDNTDYELKETTDNSLILSEKTVTITGVRLLDYYGGSEMIKETKVYDGKSVVCDSAGIDWTPDVSNVTIVFKWQKQDGENYSDIEGNTAPKDVGSYRLHVEAVRGSSVLGDLNLPFTISQRTLNVIAAVQEKDYDRNDDADVTIAFTNVATGDNVIPDTANMNALFESPDAGENKIVTVTGLALKGDEADNYKLPEAITGTGKINAADGSATVDIEDWTYGDEANSPAAQSSTNGGTAVIEYKLASEADSAYKEDVPTNAGTYTVRATFAATNNYKAVTAEKNFTISKRTLNIKGASVEPKTYDESTDAKVTEVTFEGLQNGETLALNTDYTVSDAAYNSADADKASKVTFTVTLSGTGVAKNYSLADSSAEVEASIGKAAIADYEANTIGKRGKQNSYEIPEDWIVPGGSVSIAGTGGDTAIFDSNPTYENNSLNYTLAKTATEEQSGTVTLTVTSANFSDYDIVVKISVAAKEEAIINVTGGTCTYDGTAKAPEDISVSGNKVPVSELEKHYVGTGTTEYDSTDAPKNAGSYTVTVSVSGNNLKYYGSAVCAFTISPKELNMTASAKDKTYDGGTSVVVDAALVSSDVAGTDEVSLVKDGVSAAFKDKTAGKNKEVILTGKYTIEGEAAGNYTLIQPENPTANIDEKPLTVDVTVSDKYYDGMDTAAFSKMPALVGVCENDDVTLSNGKPSFSKFTVGENIPINFTEFMLEGKDMKNYSLTQPSGITANINPYDASGAEYIAGTSDWTNQDFVVTAANGWKLSYNDTKDGEWVDSLTCTDETGNGSLTFYVRNTESGIISTAITKNYKIDKTAPVISGAENGKTYCAPVTLTITDENLESVTLNGKIVELTDGKLTVNPISKTEEKTDDEPMLFNTENASENGEQTVVATDKAGNETIITLTVNDGHTWGKWTSNGDGTHSRVCKVNAEHIQKEDCHGGKATCVKKAVCDDCKTAYGELDPNNHAGLKHIKAKAATKDAEGNVEYWYCEDCGKYYKDAEASKEISKSDTVTAKVKEKDKDKGKEENKEKINDKVPYTGDENSMALWLAIMIAGGAGAFASTVIRRKKYNK